MTLLKLTWYLIHLILTLWNTVRNVLNHVWSRISSEKSVSLSTVRENSVQLQKLPQHIGFVVVEDDISIQDLVKLMIWSAASGITYVSVYDKFGESKVYRFKSISMYSLLYS